MDPIILWQHKWSQDLFIPTYLYTGGLAAGLFIVAALADLASLLSRRFAALSRGAALAAVPVLAIAGFTLTVHLGKPERGLGFPLFFTNYNSWMTRGGWILGIASAVLVAYAVLWYFRVWPGPRRALGLLGIPILALLGLYTGFLLAGAWYVPLWSREFLPTLFLTSGLTGGVALAGLVAILAWRYLAPPDGGSRPVLRWVAVALVILIGLELYELRAYVAYLAAKAPDKALVLSTPDGEFVSPIGSRLGYVYLTGGPEYPYKLFRPAVTPDVSDAAALVPRPTLARWFWIGVVGVGLLLPLALTLVEFIADAASPRLANLAAGLKFLSTLAGGYVLRLVMVWGGDLKAPLPFPPSVWPVPGLGSVSIPGLGG
jgi:formate-dependent nitrite reductase membrane component NrfD